MNPQSASILRFMIAGSIGGLLSGMFGVGGGIVMVPLLLTLTKLGHRQSTATSLAAIVPSSLFGAGTYSLANQVSLITAIIVAIGGLVGAWIGAELLARLKIMLLRIMFAILLLGVGVVLMLHVPSRAEAFTQSLDPLTLGILVTVGLTVGICSGLFGIGGGILMVPIFLLLLDMSDVLAKGTSLAAILPGSLIGTITNMHNDLVKLKDAMVVGSRP